MAGRHNQVLRPEKQLIGAGAAAAWCKGTNNQSQSKAALEKANTAGPMGKGVGEKRLSRDVLIPNKDHVPGALERA